MPNEFNDDTVKDCGNFLYFPLAAFFLMLFWGIIAPNLGIETISYVESLLITFVLWLICPK